MGGVIHNLSVRNSEGHQKPIYYAWVNMRARCSNPKKKDYRYYGGRGITVCERWNEFANFFEDMGESFEAHRKLNSSTTLDRIDVNGGYSPSNCQWATRKDQANNRRYNRVVEYRGKEQGLGKWIDELSLNITEKNLYKRIFTRKWDVERAFTQQVR